MPVEMFLSTNTWNATGGPIEGKLRTTEAEIQEDSLTAAPFAPPGTLADLLSS